MLGMYAKQNSFGSLPGKARLRNEHSTSTIDSSAGDDRPVEPTIIEVKESTRRGSHSSSRSTSSDERSRRLSEPSIAARVDLGSKTSLLDTSIHHGTPRSVKHRDRLAKEEGPRRAMSDVPLNGARDVLLALDVDRANRREQDSDSAVDCELLDQSSKSAPRVPTFFFVFPPRFTQSSARLD